MIDPVAVRWRDALLTVMEGVGDQPLFLSGGMDSATLLAAQLELGRRPHCFTYRLGERESPDLTAAREIARAFSLTLTEVRIPDLLPQLLQDVRRVIRLTGNPRKTAVQCCHAMLYLVPAVQAKDYKAAITGTGGIVDDNRKAQILAADYAANADELEAQRRSGLLGGDPSSATETMKRCVESLGLRLIEPFSMEPLAEVALSIPFPEMNGPVQKGIACRAFPGFFRTREDGKPGRFHRKNVSLQVAGGLREHHDRLLEMPINAGLKAQRVVAIYNQIHREETDDQLGLAF